MNILRQHHQRTMAAQQARLSLSSDAVDTDVMTGSMYEQMLVQLAAHKVELKAIESIQQKAKRKGDLIPDYLPYIDGVLAANESVQDDVLMTLLVWALDASHFDLAFRIAEWAFEHDISPPPNFTRSVAAILAEQVAETALAEIEVGETDLLTVAATLSTAVEMVAERDMPDPVRAKLHKALGLSLFDSAPSDARDSLVYARQLDPKTGVKRAIEKLDRAIKLAAESDTTQNATGSPSAAPTLDTDDKAEKPETPVSGGGADRPVDAVTDAETADHGGT